MTKHIATRLSTLPLLFAAILLLLPANSKADSHGEGMNVGIWLNRHIMAEGEAAIVDFMDQAEQRGINIIMPNYWFHGYVIYPGSRYVRQHPDFIGKDPLAIVFREAQKRGMEVHPFGEYGFFAHFHYGDTEPGEESKGYILQENPDWIVRDRGGELYHYVPVYDAYYYSLNPAHPGARRFLADVLLEVMDLYPESDGLHLDRMRYQDPDYSYDEFSLKAFEAIHGTNPLEAAPEDPDTYAPWVRFREDQINHFITILSDDLRRRHPDALLTAAVVPPYFMRDKFQRWDEWAHRGQLDVAIPMMYGSPELVRRELEQVLSMLPAGVPVWGGISLGAGEEATIGSMDVLSAHGVPGVVLWDDGAFMEQELDFTPWATGERRGELPDEVETEVEEHPELY